MPEITPGFNEALKAAADEELRTPTIYLVVENYIEDVNPIAVFTREDVANEVADRLNALRPPTARDGRSWWFAVERLPIDGTFERALSRSQLRR